VNVSRARRRWRKWDQYINYLIKVTEDGGRCPPGAIKAWNERAHLRSMRNYHMMKDKS
jgi:hypothetical protein